MSNKPDTTGSCMMIDPAELIHICETTPVFAAYDAGRVDVRNAVDACEHVACVPLREYRVLQERLRHLLKSEYIRSFDEKDPMTQEYKRPIEEADQLIAYEGDWLPVDQRKPTPGERVLLLLECGFVGEGWLGAEDGRWYRYQSMLPVEMLYDQRVTHWAPLPAAPADLARKET